MQLTTFLSAATAMVATASAAAANRNAVTENTSCDKAKPYARVINGCDYPVYLWSVFKGTGCPEDSMVTLKKGESYYENLLRDDSTPTGISIKGSASKQCKTGSIVQLEYFLETTQPGYNFNYLDVSYVDCTNDDCPTKKEGFYLQAGNQTGEYASSAGNTWCPILSCSDSASCAKMAYINPDDVQTKSCDLKQNLEFHMCGSNIPTDDGSSPSAHPSSSAPASSAPASSSAAASSSKKAASSAPASKPTTTLSKAVSSSKAYKVNAAAVTNVPEAKKVKTQVVYVTAYEYVNAKRHEHAHAHARRHQPFNA